jgi:hypothetical protein
MKPRKSERARLEATLTDAGDGDRELGDVVDDVFSVTTEIMLERDWYAIVAMDGPAVYHWGPYESEHKAKTALKQLTSPGPDPMKVYIYKMYRAQEAT